MEFYLSIKLYPDVFSKKSLGLGLQLMIILIVD